MARCRMIAPPVARGTSHSQEGALLLSAASLLIVKEIGVIMVRVLLNVVEEYKQEHILLIPQPQIMVLRVRLRLEIRKNKPVIQQTVIHVTPQAVIKECII